MKGASKLCPLCHKLLVKDISLKEGSSIVLRCPKCQKDAKVEAKTIIKVVPLDILNDLR